MGNSSPRKILECTLVPAGVLLLLLYHLYLFHRIRKYPMTTVIGVNAKSRRRWVEAMMSDQPKNGGLSVQVLRNTLKASIILASTAITLCSLIAVLLKHISSKNGSNAMLFGEDTDTIRSIKYFSILLCFLVAFLCNVESIRFYNHASFLMNVPVGDNMAVDLDHAVRAVDKGSFWWSMGLKAFYFSFPLFLWVFGPIPMFACCVFMVVLLFFLDRVPSSLQPSEEGQRA